MGMALALTRRRVHEETAHERADYRLAAGGTGGHLFGQGLASALLTRGPRPVLVTDARRGVRSRRP